MDSNEIKTEIKQLWMMAAFLAVIIEIGFVLMSNRYKKLNERLEKIEQRN